MGDSAATHPGLHGSSEYDLLDRLAEEFIERYRRGDRPSLGEYTDRHPALAEEIRDLFPALVQIEQVEGGLRDAGTRKGGAEPAPGPIPPPRRVGDFEIIREVGRGGMGVVYDADQVSLGRRVALKIMARAATGDANTLGRFRREARAAARLHHTNIVPVYEVGQEGDIFYYAMQFIEGQGLDLVIAELRRIRDIVRREGRHGRRADTVASAAAGRIPKTLDLAGNLEASRVARLLLTGQFAPGAWADGEGAGMPGVPEPG